MMSQFTKQLHQSYSSSIVAFMENYKMLGQEEIGQIDSFFRICALYFWGNYSADVEECFISLHEIYTNVKPDYSKTEIENILANVSKNKVTVKVPDFFRKIVEYDKTHGAYYSRIFIEGLQYVLMMFTLIDNKTSIEEIKDITMIMDLLGDFCDSHGVKEHHFESNLYSYVTTNTLYDNSLEKEIPKARETKGYKKVESQPAINRLNQLIGLQSVKDEIRAIVNFVQVQNMRKDMKLPTTDVSYHLVFTGNPGTGKTTVARLVAEIYRDLGVISKGHLIEAERSDLVAGYVGQTAIKTKEIIAKAMGGVLFIDEAYALLDKDDQSFGQEAINTLLKEMEDHRDDLVVIVAGYDGRMVSVKSDAPS